MNDPAAPVRMNSAVKTDAFHQVLAKMAAGEKLDPALWNRFVDAQNDGLRTGPAVGSRVPAFALPDQDGKLRTLADLAGPNGLLLVFTRSADW
jgi:hypothetical protein